MADQFQYSKERRKFGRHAQFEDTEIQIVGKIDPNPDHAKDYIVRNPNKLVLDNIPQMSEHRVSYIIFFPLPPQPLTWDKWSLQETAEIKAYFGLFFFIFLSDLCLVIIG